MRSSIYKIKSGKIDQIKHIKDQIYKTLITDMGDGQFVMNGNKLILKDNSNKTIVQNVKTDDPLKEQFSDSNKITVDGKTFEGFDGMLKNINFLICKFQ